MIKAIVLDLGGVLIDLDLQSCKNAFKENLGFNKIDEILDPYHQKGIYSDLEEGLITVDEFRAAVLRDSRPGSRPEDVDRSMDALLSGMNPGKVPFLKSLCKRYPLYALSNNNPIAMAAFHRIYEKNGMDYREVFTKEFLSFELKMLKPSLEIYREVVRLIGLPAEELLFVDDSIDNVEAARAVGMNAVQYIQGTDLPATIENALAGIDR